MMINSYWYSGLFRMKPGRTFGLALPPLGNPKSVIFNSCVFYNNKHAKRVISRFEPRQGSFLLEFELWDGILSFTTNFYHSDIKKVPIEKSVEWQFLTKKVFSC